MAGILFWVFILLIVYTYAGFPVLLALVAQLKPKLRSYSYLYPKVTLIIAAFNEEKIIEAKIENSLSLDYPKENLQILVANDCSTDRTAEIVKKFAGRGVEIDSGNERKGKVGNLNRAVKSARGEIIVIADATNMYDRDALKELVAPFSDPAVGVVGGIHAIYKGDGPLGDSEGLYWKYETNIQTNETRLGSCITVNGDILAIRRELWEDIPGEVINDDLYLALSTINKGKRVVVTPKAIGRERVSPSAQDETTRRTRMFAGIFQAMEIAPRVLSWKRPSIIWQVVSHKYMRPLVPFWMLGAFLTSLIALVWPPASGRLDIITLATPYNWIFFAIQVLGYLLAWIGNTRENKSTANFIFYLPTFLVNSNLAALKGFFRYLNRQQSNRWERVGRRDMISQ